MLAGIQDGMKKRMAMAEADGEVEVEQQGAGTDTDTDADMEGVDDGRAGGAAQAAGGASTSAAAQAAGGRVGLGHLRVDGGLGGPAPAALSGKGKAPAAAGVAETSKPKAPTPEEIEWARVLEENTVKTEDVFDAKIGGMTTKHYDVNGFQLNKRGEPQYTILRGRDMGETRGELVKYGLLPADEGDGKKK